MALHDLIDSAEAIDIGPRASPHDASPYDKAPYDKAPYDKAPHDKALRSGPQEPDRDDEDA